MDIGERIKYKRTKKQMTLEDVSYLVGVSRQTLSRYETGIIKGIPSDRIEKIARALGTTPAYLMGWEDDGVDIFSIPNITPPPETYKVPRLGSIACGEPILAEENIEGYDNIPINEKCDFTLVCKGDSMTGARINDGDIVGIKQQPMVENGEIAAVLIDNEATLKRFYKYGNTVLLRAENPDFKDLEYRNGQLDEMQVIGKATFFISDVK